MQPGSFLVGSIILVSTSSALLLCRELTSLLRSSTKVFHCWNSYTPPQFHNQLRADLTKPVHLRILDARIGKEHPAERLLSCSSRCNSLHSADTCNHSSDCRNLPGRSRSFHMASYNFGAAQHSPVRPYFKCSVPSPNIQF